MPSDSLKDQFNVVNKWRGWNSACTFLIWFCVFAFLYMYSVLFDFSVVYSALFPFIIIKNQENNEWCIVKD